MATKKRTSKPKTKRASKKPKRALKRTSRKPVTRKMPTPKVVSTSAGPIEFSNEDAVLAEVCRDINVNVEDAHIRNVDSQALGNVSMYEITVGHGQYPQEYFVVEDEDAAHTEAIARVKQDLENEPEIFNQSFIESHINMERLRRDLHSDVEEGNLDYAREAGAERFWDEAGQWGIDVPDEDEDGNRRDPTDDEIETFAEKMTEDQLKDPMQYLEDIYGKEDAAKQAIKIAGIDIDAAADEAVGADGEGHFLSSYDGNTSETKPSRFVWWRHN